VPAALTHRYLEALAAWTAGEAPFPAVPLQIALGTGGLRTGPDDPAPPDPSRTALVAEVHRKPVEEVRREGERVVVRAVVRGEEVGEVGLSEAGLYDGDGRLILYATFRRKDLAPYVQLEFRFVIGGQNG